MKIKSKIFVAAVGLVGGVLLLGATQGSELDPLVTLSYLSDVLTPSILEQVDTKIADSQTGYTTQLDQAIDQYETQIEDKLSQAGAGDISMENTSVFQTVTLTSGQTLTLSAGGELLLRSGTATCAATPEVVDSTLGENLAKGDGLTTNHLYLVMAEGPALTATSDVTVLVRGTYSVS